MCFTLNSYRVKDRKITSQSWGPRLEFVPWPQGYRVLGHLMLFLSEPQAALFQGTHHIVHREKKMRASLCIFLPLTISSLRLSYGLLWKVWGCQVGEYISSRFPALRRVSVTSRPISKMVPALPSWQDRAGRNMTVLGRIGRLMLCLLSSIENTCQGPAAVPTRLDGSQGQWYSFLYMICL